MLAAGIILLIACANLAGLTLVRMLRRTSEIATRLALGASSAQIQSQLWVENLLLAFLGGLAGVGVGFLALHGLLSLLPEGFLPVSGVSLDGRVLAFTLAVALITCLLFGMLPALATRKVDLRSSMATRSGSGVDRLRLRQALIAGEVALTVVLLAASGLLIRTLIHLETLPPGFNPQGVLTAKVSLDDARYHDPAAFARLLDTSTAAMMQIPGVRTAAVGLTLPYERALNSGVTIRDGKEAGQEVGTDVVYITPGYFDALEIPLLAGRRFNAGDGIHSQKVAIVNRAFARRVFHGADPIGRTLNKGTVIVGLVVTTEYAILLNPNPTVSLTAQGYTGYEQIANYSGVRPGTANVQFPAGVPGGPPTTIQGQRKLIDLVGTVHATKALTIAANYDSGSQSCTTPYNATAPQNCSGPGVSGWSGYVTPLTGSVAQWSGLALFGVYQITPTLTGTVRYEGFHDPNGYNTGYNQLWHEGTLAFAWAVTPQLTLRTEYRHDTSSLPVFASPASAVLSNGAVYAVGNPGQGVNGNSTFGFEALAHF